MKPTPEELMAAVIYMASMMPFFPQKEMAWHGIAKQFGDFVSTKERLDWFVDTAIKTFAAWPGIPHFIALYSTRYALPPGIKQTVELPGYSTKELEDRYEDRDRREREKLIEQYTEKAKLLPPPEPGETLLLPGKVAELARPLPQPDPEDVRAATVADDARDWRIRLRSLPSREDIRAFEEELQARKKQPRTAEENDRLEAELRREIERRNARAAGSR